MRSALLAWLVLWGTDTRLRVLPAILKNGISGHSHHGDHLGW